METEDEKKLLEDVFGESSSSDSDTYPELNYNPNWLRIESINGLWLCTDFLSPTHQSSLLSAIHTEGWFTEESHNQGICAHIDLMRFEDGIAIVSLESACVMHFTPVERDGNEVPLAVKVPVNLNPGSLVIMWGDARYKWKHEINRKPGFQVWQGQEIEQRKRTSVTLRKLCEEPVDLT